MEPRIQYAKTKDGVNIAYWTLGEGAPLVSIPAAEFSHIQLEWQAPQVRRWYEGLAEKRMLVRYDGRGTGLSDRDVADYSLDALVLDLEAVIDRLGLERMTLLGLYGFGPVAIAYAARHPERVSHLILWLANARGGDRSPALQALYDLGEKDWSLYTDAMAGLFGGRHDEVPAAARFFRESVTPEAAKAIIDASREFDVASLLPRVTSLTLVLHRRQYKVLDVDVAKRLASTIPDAHLVLLEGDSPFVGVGDMEAVLAAIDEFLGEGEEAPAAELPEGMAVILFADIAESTALTERMGDAAFRAKARELDTFLRSVIRECAGTPVEGKVLGDGVLAVFTSARQAIECALRCNLASEPVGLRLHLGIHAGDVIREGNNVYGGAVNIAARIAGASAPGEVLVSDTVRGLARTSAGVTFDDRGEQTLKGIAEPQRLFAVRGGD
jgi:class 3 adenylate cyclase